MISPNASLMNALKRCLLSQSPQFWHGNWALHRQALIRNFVRVNVLMIQPKKKKKKVACMNIQSWVITPFHSLRCGLKTHVQMFLFALRCFFFKRVLPVPHPRHICTRLQPKGPTVARTFWPIPSALVAPGCIFSACEEFFPLQNLRGILVLFPAVLFRICPVPCFGMLATFLKDAVSHDGVVSQHLWFPWIHTDASVVSSASPTC